MFPHFFAFQKKNMLYSCIGCVMYFPAWSNSFDYRLYSRHAYVGWPTSVNTGVAGSSCWNMLCCMHSMFKGVTIAREWVNKRPGQGQIDAFFLEEQKAASILLPSAAFTIVQVLVRAYPNKNSKIVSKFEGFPAIFWMRFREHLKKNKSCLLILTCKRSLNQEKAKVVDLLPACLKMVTHIMPRRERNFFFVDANFPNSRTLWYTCHTKQGSRASGHFKVL